PSRVSPSGLTGPSSTPRSDGLIGDASTATTTWPSPNSGSGRSSNESRTRPSDVIVDRRLRPRVGAWGSVMEDLSGGESCYRAWRAAGASGARGGRAALVELLRLGSGRLLTTARRATASRPLRKRRFTMQQVVDDDLEHTGAMTTRGLVAFFDSA